MQSPGIDLRVVGTRLTETLYQLLTALPMLVIAILLVLATWKLGGWLSRRAWLSRAISRNPFLRDLAQTTTRWVITLIGIIVALDLLDATAMVGAIAGTAGVFGLALGFAFKDTLENYLAGVLMSLRQPFAPNDEVVIDGHHGSVVALTARATVLMTMDGNHLRIPNALVFRSVMLNYTRNPARRFEFDVGVGVQEDLVAAQQMGVATLAEQDGVMSRPPPRAFIQSLGDSNVQIRFLGWVDQRTHDFLLVRSEAIRVVKLALEAADMDMPEPIYRVQLSDARSHDAAGSVAMPSVPVLARKQRTSVSSSNVDTSRISDLDEQITEDRRKRDSEDLLSPTAPKE